MGNDGGVIAVKRKFMRHGNPKARSEKQNEEARRQERAQTCAISAEPLREPIVACALGNLYNKQALLEHLLAHSVPEKFQHITSLKDVVTCRFSKQSESVSSSNSGNGSLETFVCPITMLEFNGKQPFVVMPTCGCVLSERAMKAVNTTECLVCGKPMSGTEPIALLPPEDQYADAQKLLLASKAAQKLAKKHKKKHKGKSENKSETTDATLKKKGKRKAHKMVHDSEADSARLSKVAREASDTIAKSKEKSQVYASLFSKTDKNDKQSANDLLMTVGGMRYTLS